MPLFDHSYYQIDYSSLLSDLSMIRGSHPISLDLLAERLITYLSKHHYMNESSLDGLYAICDLDRLSPGFSNVITSVFRALCLHHVRASSNISNIPGLVKKLSGLMNNDSKLFFNLLCDPKWAHLLEDTINGPFASPINLYRCYQKLTEDEKATAQNRIIALSLTKQVDNGERANRFFKSSEPAYATDSIRSDVFVDDFNALKRDLFVSINHDQSANIEKVLNFWQDPMMQEAYIKFKHKWVSGGIHSSNTLGITYACFCLTANILMNDQPKTRRKTLMSDLDDLFKRGFTSVLFASPFTEGHFWSLMTMKSNINMVQFKPSAEQINQLTYSQIAYLLLSERFSNLFISESGSSTDVPLIEFIRQWLDKTVDQLVLEPDALEVPVTLSDLYDKIITESDDLPIIKLPYAHLHSGIIKTLFVNAEYDPINFQPIFRGFFSNFEPSETNIEVKNQFFLQFTNLFRQLLSNLPKPRRLPRLMSFLSLYGFYRCMQYSPELRHDFLSNCTELMGEATWFDISIIEFIQSEEWSAIDQLLTANPETFFQDSDSSTKETDEQNFLNNYLSTTTTSNNHLSRSLAIYSSLSDFKTHDRALDLFTTLLSMAKIQTGVNNLKQLNYPKAFTGQLFDTRFAMSLIKSLTSDPLVEPMIADHLSYLFSLAYEVVNATDGFELDESMIKNWLSTIQYHLSGGSLDSLIKKCLQSRAQDSEAEYIAYHVKLLRSAFAVNAIDFDFLLEIKLSPECLLAQRLSDDIFQMLADKIKNDKSSLRSGVIVMTDQFVQWLAKYCLCHLIQLQTTVTHTSSSIEPIISWLLLDNNQLSEKSSFIATASSYCRELSDEKMHSLFSQLLERSVIFWPILFELVMLPEVKHHQHFFSMLSSKFSDTAESIVAQNKSHWTKFFSLLKSYESQHSQKHLLISVSAFISKLFESEPSILSDHSSKVSTDCEKNVLNTATQLLARAPDADLLISLDQFMAISTSPRSCLAMALIKQLDHLMFNTLDSKKTLCNRFNYISNWHANILSQAEVFRVYFLTDCQVLRHFTSTSDVEKLNCILSCMHTTTPCQQAYKHLLSRPELHRLIAALWIDSPKTHSNAFVYFQSLGCLNRIAFLTEVATLMSSDHFSTHARRIQVRVLLKDLMDQCINNEQSTNIYDLSGLINNILSLYLKYDDSISQIQSKTFYVDTLRKILILPNPEPILESLIKSNYTRHLNLDANMIDQVLATPSAARQKEWINGACLYLMHLTNLNPLAYQTGLQAIWHNESMGLSNTVKHLITHRIIQSDPATVWKIFHELFSMLGVFSSVFETAPEHRQRTLNSLVCLFDQAIHLSVSHENSKEQPAPFLLSHEPKQSLFSFLVKQIDPLESNDEVFHQKMTYLIQCLHESFCTAMASSHRPQQLTNIFCLSMLSVEKKLGDHFTQTYLMRFLLGLNSSLLIDNPDLILSFSKQCSNYNPVVPDIKLQQLTKQLKIDFDSCYQSIFKNDQNAEVLSQVLNTIRPTNIIDASHDTAVDHLVALMNHHPYLDQLNIKTKQRYLMIFAEKSVKDHSNHMCRAQFKAIAQQFKLTPVELIDTVLSKGHSCDSYLPSNLAMHFIFDLVPVSSEPTYLLNKLIHPNQSTNLQIDSLTDCLEDDEICPSLYSQETLTSRPAIANFFIASIKHQLQNNGCESITGSLRSLREKALKFEPVGTSQVNPYHKVFQHILAMRNANALGDTGKHFSYQAINRLLLISAFVSILLACVAGAHVFFGMFAWISKLVLGVAQCLSLMLTLFLPIERLYLVSPQHKCFYPEKNTLNIGENDNFLNRIKHSLAEIKNRYLIDRLLSSKYREQPYHCLCQYFLSLLKRQIFSLTSRLSTLASLASAWTRRLIQFCHIRLSRLFFPPSNRPSILSKNLKTRPILQRKICQRSTSDIHNQTRGIGSHHR